jgi:hypothetical protein
LKGAKKTYGFRGKLLQVLRKEKKFGFAHLILCLSVVHKKGDAVIQEESFLGY